MSNLKEGEQPNYNDEPVLYCRHCLSLRIISVPKLEDSDFCDVCGNTNIDSCSIQQWEQKYINKYGHKYLENY